MATATKLATMKAIRIILTGDLVLVQKDARRPEPSTQEVLIGVYPAGVMDTMGGDVLTRSLRVLKKGGIVVSTLDEPSAEDLDRYGVRADVVASGDSGQLMLIARLIDSGEVRSMVEMAMPLAEARRALEMSQAGHVRGKIVLRIKE